MIQKFAIYLVSVLFSNYLHANLWEEMSEPSLQPSQSIGSYANGCLSGAEALPLNGEGYQVIRPQRQRFYAHPDAVDFIVTLAKELHQAGSPNLLIADMAMARGGLFSFGHRSHQTGLDIDVWFRMTDEALAQPMLENPKAVSMVDIPNYRISNEWEPQHYQMVKHAAQKERVARIFVHPVIKEQLCVHENESIDRSWLRKVRPWFGHHSHMHVRLKCAVQDKLCIDQTPPPEGDGCGAELASWKPKPGDPVDKPSYTKKRKKKPEQCQALLEG